MTTQSTPASTMRASIACVSTGSGVVSFVGMVSSPIIEHTVPIRPTFLPASSRMDLSRKLVVVLPFVPVMPIMHILRAGLS